MSRPPLVRPSDPTVRYIHGPIIASSSHQKPSPHVPPVVRTRRPPLPLGSTSIPDGPRALLPLPVSRAVLATTPVQLAITRQPAPPPPVRTRGFLARRLGLCALPSRPPALSNTRTAGAKRNERGISAVRGMGLCRTDAATEAPPHGTGWLARPPARACWIRGGADAAAEAVVLAVGAGSEDVTGFRGTQSSHTRARDASRSVRLPTGRVDGRGPRARATVGTMQCPHAHA